MSAKRATASAYRLVFNEDGKAELIHDGQTIWASDDDEEFVEEFGETTVKLTSQSTDENEDTIGDVLDYLIGTNKISMRDAENADISWPEDVHVFEDEDDDDEPGEDDDLDPDWDKDDEDEDEDD